ILARGSMVWILIASRILPILMACVLLSDLRASIKEVAKVALVAGYGQKNKMDGLQSYAFMALAAGGVLDNLHQASKKFIPSQELFTWPVVINP
ncbi:probable folate-biopterin transporter 8, chloroplastic isoform X2, partial [Tanacetum coccineum]